MLQKFITAGRVAMLTANLPACDNIYYCIFVSRPLKSQIARKDYWSIIIGCALRRLLSVPLSCEALMSSSSSNQPNQSTTNKRSHIAVCVSNSELPYAFALHQLRIIQNPIHSILHACCSLLLIWKNCFCLLHYSRCARWRMFLWQSD